MSKSFGQTMSNRDAIEYVENFIPDMLGEVSEETAEEFEHFCNRIRYLTAKDIGAKPKCHKGKYIADYWTCGNCGHSIRNVNQKYCGNCGFFLTLQFPNYDREVSNDSE